MSDYQSVELYKRSIRKKFQEFPKFTFIIYIILAICSAILVAYLLTLNYNNDSIFNIIITWIIFIVAVLLFIINIILIFVDFPMKKIIIIISVIAQVVLASIAVILSNIYGHISPSNQLYVFISVALNVIAGVSALAPIYFI